MDRASSLIYPGSRTLAGWWRQLQPQQPRAFQVGYGYVHRIDAPVEVCREQPTDALTHLLLQAIILDPNSSLDELHARLQLPVAVLRQILLAVECDGLLERTDRGHWRPTERGRHALAHRWYPLPIRCRSTLSFLERLNPLGQRSAPPLFVPLAENVGVPWQVDDSHRFDPAWLQSCIAQSAEWKKRHGFPREIESLALQPGVPAWEQVIVDRAERFLFVLLRSNAEWIGYSARADGWNLFDQTPIMRLPVTDGTLGSDLLEAPALPVWQDAWRDWCKQRNLPLNEAESCTLTYQPPRLEVQAPERLVQRLRAAKSDLLKGEAWLLVGDGFVRTAAVITIV